MGEELIGSNEAMRLLGCTYKTLLALEKRGELKAVGRTVQGYRKFNSKDVLKLKQRRDILRPA